METICGLFIMLCVPVVEKMMWTYCIMPASISSPAPARGSDRSERLLAMKC